MSKIVLPPAPPELQTDAVMAWTQAVVIDTYEPMPPDRNPMFLEKRVYQGSRGTVYPMPFSNRIAEIKTPVEWEAVHLENRYLRIMILPQIGGRIHVALDKTNGYDFIYRQNVIKPALVGLAGPWASGGIEFNWPQHHRPGTYLPTTVAIEAAEDGSRTVWLSEHDPLNRLKGMHGVCLHPDKAYIEVKVRLFNRTPLPQTFLWWANVATRVNEQYQSFFPPDVDYVADHAKRAMSRFPLCEGRYYGVDYARRGREGVPDAQKPRCFVPPGSYAPQDLSWYANIPVPTSYMAMGSRQDFFGGYDHARQAGIVHIANHHVSPGKKQWTWGNHEFGYAWDRNLTDDDGPYIELMAGVFTDNQPDFSHLLPGETRTFEQYWYPIQAIGPAHHATLRGAVSLSLRGTTVRMGVWVSEVLAGAEAVLTWNDGGGATFSVDLDPGSPLVREVEVPPGITEPDLNLMVLDSKGGQVLAYRPVARTQGPVPAPATEPPAPSEIASSDELFLTGLHLEQYRHATRSPVPYWQEIVRRDPADSRANNALGLWHYRRGEFDHAQTRFRRALERLTLRNPNPADGEPSYNLGLTLRQTGDFEGAYDAFYKAAWNQAWAAPAYHALAELDARKQQWGTAETHLKQSLRMNQDNLRARNLLVTVLRKQNRDEEARVLLDETLALDPLDSWALLLAGRWKTGDTQIRFDIALDMESAGLFGEALDVLASAAPEPFSGSAPMLEYYRGYLYALLGRPAEAELHFLLGAAAVPDYCFPARLQEIAILKKVMEFLPDDARAFYYLGNLYYDRRRHEDAIEAWEAAAKRDPEFPTVWRNLGIAYFNVSRKPAKAKAAYARAVKADPLDARLAYERDQLWKRLGETPERRLAALTKIRLLVGERDDLSLEYCALLSQTGRNQEALDVLSNRNFQPWEGGEGVALGLHVRIHLALGKKALARGDSAGARSHFASALASPPHLGEAKHLLANQSDIHYWLGLSLKRAGQIDAGMQAFEAAAQFEGDFQEMSVRPYSEMTYFQALSLRELGREKEAKVLLSKLMDYALRLESSEAKIDYFATSLPTMLLFEDDLDRRRTTASRLMQAQAKLGLGNKKEAARLLLDVLERDPNNTLAMDLAREIGAVEEDAPTT